jgi:hypothetical protein
MRGVAAGDLRRQPRQRARRVGDKAREAGAGSGATVEGKSRFVNRLDFGAAKSGGQRLERARRGGDPVGIDFCKESDKLWVGLAVVNGS